MLNASIFGNMLAQPKSPEEYLAERQQLEQGKMANMLNQQKIESYKRDQERQNNLLLMQKRGATADELASAGYYDEASKAYNFSSAKEADQREKAKFTLGVQRDLARRVMAAPSGQSAMAAIDEMERITGQNMDSERQKVAMFQSPDDYRRWAAGHAMTAEQLLPTFGTLNTGGAILDRTVDPVTGKVTVIGSTKMTPTPGQLIQEGNNIRSNERMIGNGGGGGVAMSKPFELTGEDGQQVVVQQDKQGNIRPVQGFSPKPAAPNAAQQKELMSINQQRSIVNGALNAVTSTPGAFTFKRGVAGKLPFGETLAGRTETPQETQARAYVFNNVSRVINERAGAAQSAQELARLNSFLPADTDGPEQIKNKLNGFITYLNDLESGTRGKPTQAGGAPQMPTKPAGGAKFLGYE